jgi:hypothetical protein
MSIRSSPTSRTSASSALRARSLPKSHTRNRNLIPDTPNLIPESPYPKPWTIYSRNSIPQTIYCRILIPETIHPKTVDSLLPDITDLRFFRSEGSVTPDTRKMILHTKTLPPTPYLKDHTTHSKHDTRKTNPDPETRNPDLRWARTRPGGSSTSRSGIALSPTPRYSLKPLVLSVSIEKEPEPRFYRFQLNA